MSDLLYAEVFNRKEGISGKVISVNPDFLSIEFDNKGEKETQAVSYATFKRWYNIVSKPEEEDLVPTSGDILRTSFMKILNNEFGSEEIEIFYNDKKKLEIVKYNGRNIFEITATKDTLNVMCHPNSLTAVNMSKAYKTFPKEWNWSLRTKFIFRSASETPLMRSIIADGIYYRKSQS